MRLFFFQSRPTDLTLVLLYVSNITDWQLNHKLNIWVGGSLATAINYPHVWRTSTFVVVCMKCTKHSTKCILVHAKSSLWVSHHNFFLTVSHKMWRFDWPNDNMTWNSKYNQVFPQFMCIIYKLNISKSKLK